VSKIYKNHTKIVFGRIIDVEKVFPQPMVV